MVSKLEVEQFCESMKCEYAEVSVFGNLGIDELVHLVIAKCILLEKTLIDISLNEIKNTKKSTLNGEERRFSMTTNASSAPDVQPLKLRGAKKKQNGCCG